MYDVARILPGYVHFIWRMIWNSKRLNPLSSARALSSEGLVLRHSWPRAPRNLRSIAHRTGETV